MCFFLILAEKLVRCVETVIYLYRGKNVKRNCWTIGFSSFLDFDKKNLCLFRKVFGRVVKNTFDVSSGTPTEQNFLMEVSKTRGFSDNFWSFRDKGGNTFFRVGQTAIDVRGNSLWKKYFQKRKVRYFFRFRAFFLLLAKKVARFAKHAVYVSVEVFGEKHPLKFI